jgi:anti-sigma regulatory factor (Ser/Thr protein kinase)
MTIMLPAVPDSLAVVRARMREWLARAGLDSESCADVLLAVGEATANAAEHAVVAAEHAVTVVVSAALCGKLLLVTVSDDGRWKPAAKPPQGYRGHGMTLMNALVDSVDLTATAGGTTVQMRKELP